MKRNVTNRVYLLLALLPLLWGCGDSLTGLMHRRAADSVPVSVVVSRESGGRSRTVAPDHVPAGDLENTGLYRLVLTGTSDMGSSVTVDPFRIANGMGGFDLSPGAWSLTLAAHTVAGNTKVLEGTAFVIIVDYHVTVYIDLEPLQTENGSVSAQFTLPQSVVKRLDPQNSNNKPVKVALYDEAGGEVAGTARNFTLTYSTSTASYSINYNNASVAAGEYTLKMTASYTVNTASTSNQDRTHTFGWSDILYVEGNRASSVVVAIEGTALGVPDRPYLRATPTAGGNSPSNQFNISELFNPWGETLWLYGHSWDGNGNDTNGNEILVVDWDPVYNADYYEVEVLLHPFTKNAQTVTANGKFNKVVTTDAAWDTLRTTSFNYGGRSLTPSYLRYSGGVGRSDYYKTAYYTINCNTSDQFLSCADKVLARSLFPNKGAAVGKVNAQYSIAATTDAFDTYGTFLYNGLSRGKVGMEGDCSVIGILVPAFSPQTSLVYRLRAVNQYGYSDWVYWRGGKW